MVTAMSYVFLSPKTFDPYMFRRFLMGEMYGHLVTPKTTMVSEVCTREHKVVDMSTIRGDESPQSQTKYLLTIM